MSTVWVKSNKDRKKLKDDVALLLENAAAWDWLGEEESPVLLKPNLVVSSPASGEVPRRIDGLIFDITVIRLLTLVFAEFNQPCPKNDIRREFF